MSDLKQLENQKIAMQSMIQTKNELEQLMTNPLFKKHILDGFCKDDCTRAVHLSVDSNMPVEVREDALRLAQASGYLMKYIQLECSRGYEAEGRMTELDEALEEARASA